jgi:hypothetical protein
VRESAVAFAARRVLDGAGVLLRHTWSPALRGLSHRAFRRSLRQAELGPACEPDFRDEKTTVCWGCCFYVNGDWDRRVNKGISANAMHHISTAMIAGYQNNIGMTYLLCQKTLTRGLEFPAITVG